MYEINVTQATALCSYLQDIALYILKNKKQENANSKKEETKDNLKNVFSDKNFMDLYATAVNRALSQISFTDGQIENTEALINKRQ